MKISELKVGASNFTITAKVVQKDEPREVATKYGKRVSVANIIIQDDSGTMPMSLWGDEIKEVNVGDTIEVSNGYITEFRGTPQLSAGKFGKIKIIEKGEGGSDSDERVESDSEEDY
jgi:replication factor A1